MIRGNLLANDFRKKVLCQTWYQNWKKKIFLKGVCYKIYSVYKHSIWYRKLHKWWDTANMCITKLFQEKCGCFLGIIEEGTKKPTLHRFASEKDSGHKINRKPRVITLHMKIKLICIGSVSMWKMMKKLELSLKVNLQHFSQLSEKLWNP